MADIYQLPPGIIVDPFWDFALGTIPLWLIFAIFLFFILVIINVYWMIKFMVMAPVRGAGVASKATGIKTQQAFMFGKNRSFSIQALEYVDGILSYPKQASKTSNNIDKWRLTSPTSVGTIGEKPVLIASDSYECIRDPVAEMALCRIVKEVNANNKDNKDVQITDYPSLCNMLVVLEMEYPDGIPIPTYGLYDPAEVQAITPKEMTSKMLGGNLIRRARALNMHIAEPGLLEKYLPLMIFAGVGMIGIIITFMYVTGAKSPV
jgi:hypothetical protein